MSGWAYADIWEEIVAAVPHRAALIQGQRTLSWRALDARANAVAAHVRSRLADDKAAKALALDALKMTA